MIYAEKDDANPGSPNLNSRQTGKYDSTFRRQGKEGLELKFENQTVSTDIKSLQIGAKNPQDTNTVVGGTIVMQVRGEMGNHLQKIAHGYGVHWYGRDQFQLQTELRMRHLKKPKWKTARNDIYQCFPSLRSSVDYESGHDPEFKKLQTTQNEWYQTLLQQHQEQKDQLATMMLNTTQIRDSNIANISYGLLAMKGLASQSSYESKTYYQREYPIVVLGGPMRNVLVDEYYDRYRRFFQFDNSACCAVLPDPDEIVFHFRHFAKELSVEEQKSRGFEELDPRRVASTLLGHLKPGQKVAITTRFDSEPLVQEYVRELEERQLQVRLVTNQTGVQDFCFLLRAKQELVGVAKSTYARWAAYLGDAQRVQLYSLNNPGSEEFIEQTMKYPWKHAEIKRRIKWPVFETLLR